MTVEFTAVNLFFVFGQLHRAQNLSCFHEKQTPVGGDSCNMSFLIRTDAVRVIHLPERGDFFQSVLERKNLHASGGPDVVITIRALCDASDGIGRKPFALIDDIDDLLVDEDNQAVVVGSDPQAAFVIRKQAVHVPYGIIVVHPFEFPPVIAVQAGIGTDPQDAVGGLFDIVVRTAGQTIVIAVDCLHIIIIIQGKTARGCRLGLCDRDQHRQDEDGGSDSKRRIIQKLFLRQ